MLIGGLGPRLRELAVADSYSQRIARVVDLLKRRYAESVRIEEVANAVHMRPGLSTESTGPLMLIVRTTPLACGQQLCLL